MSMRSNLAEAAVDLDVRAIYVGRGVRSKEKSGVGQFFRLADPARWNHGGKLGESLFTLFLIRYQRGKTTSLDPARRQDIYADFAFFQFEYPGACQCANRGREDDRSAFGEQRQGLLDL